MANLQVTVLKNINQLKKNITEKASQLASLKDDLRKHEHIYALLGGGGTDTPRKRVRARRRPFVNWDSVLKTLPSSFTVNDLAKARSAKGKPKAHLWQVIVRWAKTGKVKKTARGTYQKV